MVVLPEIMPVSALSQGAAAVLMSVDAYEHGEEERLLLWRLAKGDQEIQSGQGHTLVDVLGEAEVFLHRESA